MSLLKHISNFLIEKVLPIKFKVWLLDRLACDIAAQGEDGDTELAHINSYEAKLLRSVGGSGTINKTTGLRQYGGGGSKGGGGGGGTTTQTVTKEEFPPEIRPYITDILERAQAQEEARQTVGYPVYPGPRIAAFTPEERAAQAGITSLVGASQPSFDIARGLTAASAMEDTAGAIQERMSPFMQNVVDIQKREAQRDADIRRQQLAAQAVGARAFGGSRDAIQQAEFDRNLQQQLADIQATGQQAAFQQAQQGLANLRQRQMGAGQQIAGLGTAQQAAAMRELGALSGVGEQQRQQQQKALDLGFQQFREEQTYPEASLQQYQSIIRGFPISPTTTQTQQAILPQPSLSQQLIGGAGALAGLGIAGQIPKLFEGGGQTNLKPVPEDNVGLSKLPQDVRNKMGFMSSGGSFPDLSGDGKITQKDILLGRGVINKRKGKRISKSDNKEYTEMLMALLEGKGRELTGMETLNDGGVVKMQSGQQPFMNQPNPLNASGLQTILPSGSFLQDVGELKRLQGRVYKDGNVFRDRLTGKVVPEIFLQNIEKLDKKPGTTLSIPFKDDYVQKDPNVPMATLTRKRDIPTYDPKDYEPGATGDYPLSSEVLKSMGLGTSEARSPGKPSPFEEDVVDAAFGLGENILAPAGRAIEKGYKGTRDVVSGLANIAGQYFKPGGQEGLAQAQQDLSQTVDEKSARLGLGKDDYGFFDKVTDTLKKGYQSVEDMVAKQQPGSLLQGEALYEKLRRHKKEVDVLNEKIDAAGSPAAKAELTKMRDAIIQEANTFATRYDSDINSYEDLIPKLKTELTTKDKTKPQKEIPEDIKKVAEAEAKETGKKQTEETKPVLNKNEEKGASEYLKNNINPDDPNADLLLEESKNLLKDNEPTKEAIENSSSYLRDIITRQEKESKADFEKRRGFAIAQMGFQIMGGTRIVDAAAGLMGNLSKLEQEKLERKNKQFDRELQIRALELDEMKTKKTLELGEKELAVKEKLFDYQIDKLNKGDKLKVNEVLAVAPMSVTVGDLKYTLKGAGSDTITEDKQIMATAMLSARDELGTGANIKAIQDRAKEIFLNMKGDPEIKRKIFGFGKQYLDYPK
tara:strand:- start:1430 stop:4699 length:3270 start_codon:yes stop_codon:yes gene_type:complete